MSNGCEQVHMNSLAFKRKNLKSEIPDSTSYLVKSDSALHGIPELRAEQQPVVLKRKHELAQLCEKAPSNLILVNEIFFVRLEGRINQELNMKQKKGFLNIENKLQSKHACRSTMYGFFGHLN